MQIGFSKKISETLLEDIFEIILTNIIKNKKVKIVPYNDFSAFKTGKKYESIFIKNQPKKYINGKNNIDIREFLKNTKVILSTFDGILIFFFNRTR